MFQTREEVRQVYLTVLKKMHDQSLLEPMEAIIAEVIEMHPEYHSFLQKTDTAMEKDFLPEGGETNPFLHMGMHIALREQANTDRPIGFKAIYQNLLRKRNPHETEHAMMECLAEALYQSQKNNLPFDEVKYMGDLKSL